MAFIHSSVRWRRVAMVSATLLVVLVAGLSVPACGGSSATTTTAGGVTTTVGGATTTSAGGGGSTVQVAMKNLKFDPATVTVKVGDTVTWTNEDSAQHDVIADNGEFKSDLFGKGETFSFTFTKAGTYPYSCTVHAGMTGSVTVQ